MNFHKTFVFALFASLLTAAFASADIRGEYYKWTGTAPPSDAFNAAFYQGTRTDANINFNWGNTVNPWPNVLGAGSTGDIDLFAVRWMGQINIPSSQSWTFYANTDDGVRLWIDGVLIIDSWIVGGLERSGSIALTTGWHSIRMEFFENAGQATAILSWAAASVPKAVVPQANLAAFTQSAASTATTGIQGEYFNFQPTITIPPPAGGTYDDVDSATAVTGYCVQSHNAYNGNLDPYINFIWGTGAPANVNTDYFGARWRGQVNLPTDGPWTLTVASIDDGGRIWVDNANLVSQWGDVLGNAVDGPLYLAAGWHDIRVDYYEHAGGASVSLYWQGPSTGYGVIPQTNLRPYFMHGIIGQYYTGNWRDTSGTHPRSASPIVVRVDGTVDFSFNDTAPETYSLPVDYFTVWWRGKVLIPGTPGSTNPYKFWVTSDDGADLYVNGQQLINNATTPQGPTEFSGSTPLISGQKYYIDLFYNEFTGGATCLMKWSGAGIGDGTDTARVVIPQTSLFPILNEPPSDMALTNNTIGSNLGANAVVGSLSSTDIDNSTGAGAGSFTGAVPTQTFTYTLVSGTGSDNNSLFNISGAQLRANANINMGTYSVRIRTTDNGTQPDNQYFEKPFTIIVNDTTSPTAPTSVTSPAYANGPIAVSYSGAADTGGSGLKVVHLWYQKNAGAWTDSGLTSTPSSGAGSFSFSGMTGNATYSFACQSEDNAGNKSATPSTAACSTIYDTTSPTVTLWTASAAYVTTPTGVIGVTITLSKAVTDLTVGKISTTNAVASGLTSSDATHYSFNLTPIVEGPFSCAIASNAIHDLATNGNLASNTINCTWDKTPPAATIITPSTLFTNGTSVSFAVTFSEPVVNFANATNVVVVTTGGTAYSGVSVSGSDASYTVQVAGLSGNGTLTVSVSLISGVADLAGNALASSVTSAAVTTDYLPPHATTITTTNPNPTNAGSVGFSVHFDEAVANFNNGTDVVVTAAGISYGGVSISGGPQDYTLSVTGVTGDGTVQVAVSTLSDVTDLAGNALASSVTSALVTVDHTPPHCLTVTTTTPSPTNASSVTYTVSFDEPVFNFNNAQDVVITQTGTVAHTGVVVTGTGQIYTVQVTGITGDGTMALAASTTSDIQDAAANGVASSVTSEAISVDHTGPSATGIVAQNPTPTNSGTVIYNVTFSESVVNFNAANDLVITRTGTLTNPGVVITGSGANYVVDLTGVSGDGTLRLAVSTSSDIHDLASNPMASSVTSGVLTVDQTAPTVTAITPSGANPTNGSTVPFTVVFSESVVNFNAANDLVITATDTAAYTGATITGGPQSYTATVTGVTGSGTLALAVSTGSDVSDLAGNALASSVTSGTVTVDHVVPTVTVDSLITNNPMPTVSGTVSDNIGVAGVLVTVNGQMYPAVVALGTWTAAVSDALPQGTYDVLARAADTAGNTATDSTTNELVVDLTPPTVTVMTQITGTTKPTLSGTVADNVGVAGVTATVNGHTYTAAVSSGTWTASVTDALAAGTYDVLAQATDTAGNTAADSTTDELTIDFNVPSVTVNTLVTNNPSPAVTGTATAQAGHNITSVSVVIHGVTYPYTPGTPANSVAWTVTPSALPDGTYDVQATARDDLGRTGNDGTTNELTIDTTAPTAAVTLLAPVETGRDALPFHVLFSEAVTGFDASVITVAGSLTGTVAVTGSSPDYTVTVTLDAPDTDGTLGIVIGSGVMDLAGNAYAGGTSPVYSVFNWRGFTVQPQGAQLYSGASQTFTVVANCAATTLAYQWKWDDGAKAVHNGPTTSTWTITPIMPANNGTYWCEVSYDGNTYPTATATLAVADHLAITGQPQGGQKVAGTSQTFTVGASGGFTPLAYQWMKDGSQILNATNASYTLNSLQLGDAGSYTVEVLDAYSDVMTSDPAILTVSGSALPLAEAAGYAALLLAVAGLRALRRR